jgi:predicted ATPase
MSSASLHQAVDAARAARTLQRVLFAAAEGMGRSHALGSLGGMPVLRVDVSRGRLVSQTLLALLGEANDDEATWRALRAAPQLRALETERALVAAELLASLLGIRRADFRTAKLDEDSRREGAFLELARWLTERAASDGLVLAFDDAHLADDDGVAFIELLSQREEPTPMVLSSRTTPIASGSAPRSGRGGRRGWPTPAGSGSSFRRRPPPRWRRS